MGFKRADPERDERIVVLTRAGESAAQIAAKVGMTQRGVVRARGRLGVALPAQVWLTIEECQRIKTMLEDGCSYKEVARTLGRSETAIARRFPGYGWNKKQGAAKREMDKLLNSLALGVTRDMTQ